MSEAQKLIDKEALDIIAGDVVVSCKLIAHFKYKLIIYIHSRQNR